jgi:hypothetical protein
MLKTPAAEKHESTPHQNPKANQTPTAARACSRPIPTQIQKMLPCRKAILGKALSKSLTESRFKVDCKPL